MTGTPSLGTDDPAPADGLSGPQSCQDLFLAFNRLSMQGFGGVLPVAQRVLVDQLRWMDRATFLQLLSLGQVLPGPNIVNIAVIYGDRCMGWRGALAALSGLMLAPLALVLLLAWFMRLGGDSAPLSGALRGMAVVSAGLIISMAIKSWPTLRRNAMGMPICIGIAATVIVLVGLLRLPLAHVIFTVGPAAWCIARWKLRS